MESSKLFELVFSQVVQTKSKQRNKSNSFSIKAIIHRIGSWPDEWNNLSLNVDKLSEFPRLGSNLFHSEKVDGKKTFLKKLCVALEIRFVLSVQYLARALQKLHGKDTQDVCPWKLYKDNVFCTNIEVYGVANLILHIISLWMYPQLLPLLQGKRYTEHIPDCHGKNF